MPRVRVEFYMTDGSWATCEIDEISLDLLIENWDISPLVLVESTADRKAWVNKRNVTKIRAHVCSE